MVTGCLPPHRILVFHFWFVKIDRNLVGSVNVMPRLFKLLFKMLFLLEAYNNTNLLLGFLKIVRIVPTYISRIWRSCLTVRDGYNYLCCSNNIPPSHLRNSVTIVTLGVVRGKQLKKSFKNHEKTQLFRCTSPSFSS